LPEILLIVFIYNSLLLHSISYQKFPYGRVFSPGAKKIIKSSSKKSEINEQIVIILSETCLRFYLTILLKEKCRAAQTGMPAHAILKRERNQEVER
jgi:hypothetical protein